MQVVSSQMHDVQEHLTLGPFLESRSRPLPQPLATRTGPSAEAVFRHIIATVLFTRKKRAMRITGIVLLLLLALQGCGRKGALFMPAHPTGAPAAPDQSEQKKQP